MAADVIYFSTPTRKITESSDMDIIARFRERATNLDVTPTNTKYRLDSNTGEVLGWTTITPGPTITIQLTSEHTKVHNPFRVLQDMTLSVASDYGLSTQYIDSLSFQIRNNPF